MLATGVRTKSVGVVVVDEEGGRIFVNGVIIVFEEG